jgi:exodeoxyribonuclease V alpha subunit
VVDEASMVDLLLFDALFAALAPDTSLILLGDPNQLESVGAGYVFGDICTARTGDRGRTAGFVSGYRKMGGSIPDPDPAATPLDDCVVELERSYRFAEGTPFARIASAVRNGENDAFFAAFADSDDASIVAPPSSAENLLALASTGIRAYAEARNLEQAFEALACFRILCAVREGPLGTFAVNTAVARSLGLGMRSFDSVCYHRRALLVTANNYSTRLFNGDVGICWTHDGRTNAHFREAGGTVREIVATKLPRCESAWAMTVHKSQGSEFDEVVLVLPNATSPVLSRELLYTGITRAKSRLTIVAADATVRRALSLTATRASGLGDRLKDRS